MTQPIVIKVGTNVLTKQNGLLDEEIIKNIVQQICDLKKQGNKVILVTSGAMGAGRSVIKFNNKTSKIEERQVLAAVGQIKLINVYEKLFSAKGYHAAQVLATKEDFRDRAHYQNMKNCFVALLKNNVIPIVNENDVVSVQELMFTDNDELSGLIAAMLNANKLLILTSVDGILNERGEVVAKIDAKTDFTQYISTEKSQFGRGGMFTKAQVAKKLARLGIATHIINGKKLNNIIKAVNNEKIGTLFLAQTKTSGAKKYLAHARGTEQGKITIDACAEKLIMDQNKTISLLPVGIIGAAGNFKKGDVVQINNEAGKVLGYGRAEYDVTSLTKILRQKNQKEFINYDYLFLEL